MGPGSVLKPRGRKPPFLMMGEAVVDTHRITGHCGSLPPPTTDNVAGRFWCRPGYADWSGLPTHSSNQTTQGFKFKQLKPQCVSV